MLSTFIAENYLLVRLLLIAALVAAVVVTAILARARHGRRIAAVLAGAGLLVIIALTLTPDTYPLDAATCNLQPYSSFTDVYNILLFLVPALFAVVATRHPLVVLAGGIAFSAGIELAQYLVPWFGRRCDVDDWLANTLGTLVGVVLAVGVSAVAMWWDRRRAASTSSAEDNE